MSKAFQRYLQNLFTRIGDILGLNEYELVFQMNEEQEYIDDQKIGMSVEIDDSYLRAYISVYPHMETLYKEKRFEEIYRFVLHEACHFFTNPMWNELNDRITPQEEKLMREKLERTTQKLANALYFIIDRKKL